MPNITGFLNSATTSRMISIDFASSCLRCLGSALGTDLMALGCSIMNSTICATSRGDNGLCQTNAGNSHAWRVHPPKKAAKEGYRAVIRNIPLCQSHSATYREDANQPNLIDKSKG